MPKLAGDSLGKTRVVLSLPFFVECVWIRRAMRGDWVRTASWAIKWPLEGPVKMSKIWVVKTLKDSAVSNNYVEALVKRGSKHATEGADVDRNAGQGSL